MEMREANPKVSGLLSVFSSESGTRSGLYRRPAAWRASAFPFLAKGSLP
jgi:hypothetical protein